MAVKSKKFAKSKKYEKIGFCSKMLLKPWIFANKYTKT